MALESWHWTCILLCGFGLFKEFRPSEPFFTPYLIEYKNITLNDLVHTAYPIYTYTYLGTLAVVFLVTDYLRYKPIVILEGISFVVVWIILTWGKTLTALIFVELFYGLAYSTEVAYYTYIYAQVKKEHYAKVTSYTYGSIFAGRFLAGSLSQLLVHFKWMDYHELNYISLGCVIVALVFSLLLPGVKSSIYFHRDSAEEPTSPEPALEHSTDALTTPPSNKLTFREKVKNTRRYMLSDLRAAYGNSYVLKWSIWWAVATAGHLQVMNFIQTLWQVIVEEDSTGSGNQDYNGVVEAIHTFISTILAIGVGHLKLKWFKWGEGLLAVASITQGAMLIWMSKTLNIYIAYATYLLFRILFQVIITVASSEVAQNINDDSFGLIFGINTFLALVMQTMITLAVVDKVGFSLSERNQFFTYGICFGVLGGFFVLVWIWTLTRGNTYKPRNQTDSDQSQAVE